MSAWLSRCSSVHHVLMRAKIASTSCSLRYVNPGIMLDPGPGLPVEERSDLSKGLARGARVYAVSCQPCHGDRHGKGSIGRAHPQNEMGHTWHHPDAQLKEWILHGKPGPEISVMPGFNYLREHDVEAVLALIKTWWTDEQRESQADISRRYDQAINKKKKAQRP